MTQKIEMFLPVKALVDVVVNGGEPECFHCEEKLPPNSKAERSGECIVVTCPYCFCLTPFPIG